MLESNNKCALKKILILLTIKYGPVIAIKSNKTLLDQRVSESIGCCRK